MDRTSRSPYQQAAKSLSELTSVLKEHAPDSAELEAADEDLKKQKELLEKVTKQVEKHKANTDVNTENDGRDETDAVKTGTRKSERLTKKAKEREDSVVAK